MRFFDRWRRLPEDEAEAEQDEATVRLLERARALPRESEPGRDLWSGIENRIRAASAEGSEPVRSGSEPVRSGWTRSALFPRPVLAAALGLALVTTTALATLWLAQPSLPSTDAGLRQLANELRDRDGVRGVHESLLEIIGTRRQELPAEALLALEDNVRRIDHALAELNLALRQHPEYSELSFLLAETYRREAELLEHIEWWMQTASGAES